MAKKKTNRGGFKISPDTGRAEGSLPDLCVREAVKGGPSKLEVLARVEEAWKKDHPEVSHGHIRSTFYGSLSEARRSGRFTETWSLGRAA